MAAPIVGYGFSLLPMAAVGLVTNDAPPTKRLCRQRRHGDRELHACGGRRHVAGDVANRVRHRVQEGDLV